MGVQAVLQALDDKITLIDEITNKRKQEFAEQIEAQIATTAACYPEPNFKKLTTLKEENTDDENEAAAANENFMDYSAAVPIVSI